MVERIGQPTTSHSVVKASDQVVRWQENHHSPQPAAVNSAAVFEHGLSSSQMREFQEKSFVSLGQVFQPKELARIRAEFLRVMKEKPEEVHFSMEGSSGKVKSIENWHDTYPALKGFSRDKRVLDAVKSVIGPDVVFHQTKYNPKAPNNDGEPWKPHRGFTFWHKLDGVQDPDKMISVFIALTDQTEENGAVFTWEGAHKDMGIKDLIDESDFSKRRSDGRDDTATKLSITIKPEKLSQYDKQFKKVRLVGPAGTVWLIDSRNLHASAENKSDQTRELVANVFRTVDNPPTNLDRDDYICCRSNEALTSYSPVGSLAN